MNYLVENNSEAKELLEALLDRYLTLKNFVYKDLIEILYQDERFIEDSASTKIKIFHNI